MEVLTRKMRIEDAKFINILSAQMGYELTLMEAINHIEQVIESKEDCAFVAVSEEKIIGWIHAFKAIRIESGSFVEIGGMVVDEDHRGKGVGRVLVNKVKEWCSEQKNNSLRVRCNNKRLEAHKFYTKLGFRETKEQKIFQLEI
jgi:GNAT superfamily N-acetyltransferase